MVHLTRLLLFVLPRVAAGLCHSGFSLPAVSAPFFEIRCRRLRTVGKKHGNWHNSSVTLGRTEQQIKDPIDLKVVARALKTIWGHSICAPHRVCRTGLSYVPDDFGGGFKLLAFTRAGFVRHCSALLPYQCLVLSLFMPLLFSSLLLCSMHWAKEDPTI